MAIDWITKSYDPSTGQTILVRNVVNHLVQDGTYRCSLAYGETFAWAELYGTYTTGTLPTGVASLTCSRTSRDPAISAGTLGDGEYLYRYDTLTYTATTSGYFDISIANPTVTLTPSLTDMNQLYTPLVSPRTREKTLDGVTSSGVSATAQMYTLTSSSFGHNAGDTFTMTYYDNTGAQQTYTETYTSGQTTVPVIASFGVKCWRGGKVTWDCNPGSSYWTGYSGTVAIAAQSKDTTLNVTSMARKTRSIRFYKVTGISSYSVTYTNSSGKRTTTTVTPTSTYSTITAFIGATVTWTATAVSGYTVSPSSGTISTSTSTTAVTVKPTAAIVSKGWYDYPVQTTGSASWSASSTTSWPSTTTSSTQSPLSSWDYLGVHTRSRISGTITVSGSYKTTFTNVEINNSSFTSVATVSVDFGVAADTFTLYVKGNSALNMYVTNTASILVRPAVAVSITSIQVYTYPASVTLSAPVNNGYDSDTYCINVGNDNAVAVSCVYNGNATWGSSDELDTGGSWEYRGPTISANSSYDVGSSDVIGTSEDESVAEMNVEIAFVADDYLNMSSSTLFEV